MKYIRTKDGVYELISNLDNKGRNNVKVKTPLGYMLIAKCTIIKQADTIEELCDEKVGTFEDGSKPYIYKQASWADLKKDWKQYHNNLYGAIWIDIKLPDGKVVKRLEPIAIMNEKGELELL